MENAMEKKRMPPVPPASRSTKGPRSDPDDAKLDNPVAEDAENIDEVGDRANVRQNSTNQQHNR
jgi:hypothetical protein